MAQQLRTKLFGKEYIYQNTAAGFIDLSKLIKKDTKQIFTVSQIKQLIASNNVSREVVSTAGLLYIDIRNNVERQLVNVGLRPTKKIIKAISMAKIGKRHLNRQVDFKDAIMKFRHTGIDLNVADEIQSVAILNDPNLRGDIDIKTRQDRLTGIFKPVVVFNHPSEEGLVRTLTAFRGDFESVDDLEVELTRRAINYGRKANMDYLHAEEIIYYPNATAAYTQNGVENIVGDTGNVRIERKAEGGEINYMIRDLKPLDIKGLFDIPLFEYENPENKNCLVNYLQNHYKKTYSFTFDATLKGLQNFIEKFGINSMLFDINGKCIYRTTGKNSKLKNIRAIIHNNHIYSIKPKTKIIDRIYKKNVAIDKNNKNVVVETDKNKFINNLLNIVKDNNIEFINDWHYVYDDKHYIFIEELETIQKIYNLVGIQNAPLMINKYNFINDILKMIDKDLVSSYFPYTFKECGLCFKNCEKIDDIDFSDILALDKNKSFSSSLASLPIGLPYIDIRTMTPQKYNGEEIKDDCLYNIEAEKVSVYFPKKYAYVWGFYLRKINKIKEMYNEPINYIITEYIQAMTKNNYYKYFLETVYNSNDDNILKVMKKAFNIHIGKMQKIIGDEEIKLEKYEFNIMTKEHITTFPFIDKSISYEVIDDDYYLTFKTKKVNKTATKNNLPLSYAIIQNARLRVIEKMIEMKIKKDDLIMIKVDCIVVKNKNNYKVELNDYDFYGWKDETKKASNPSFYPNFVEDEGFPESFFEPTIYTPIEYIANKKAGGGKTYEIVNKLIKDITHKKESYIVLATFHDILTEYRKQKINNKVIANYLYGIIPEEENIIIDEFGLCGEKEWDLILYLKYKYNKKIYLFGDATQLEPIGGYKISNFFLEKITANYDNKGWVNRRNNFTNTEYDEMIENGKDVKYCEEIINKYCKFNINDISPDKVYIAYTRATRDEMNKYIMKVLGHEMTKDNITIGMKIMNKTNGLIIGNETIYNKHSFIVKDKKDNIIILEDKSGDLYETTLEIIILNMVPAFVRTLYSVQGQGFYNMEFIDNDINVISKINNALYTLISRIKTT